MEGKLNISDVRDSVKMSKLSKTRKILVSLKIGNMPECIKT